jgi:hypothetical protein
MRILKVATLSSLLLTWAAAQETHDQTVLEVQVDNANEFEYQSDAARLLKVRRVI